MSLFTLAISLILIGVALWLINQMIPMDSKMKTILNVVVVIVVLLWLCEVFGLTTGLGDIRIGPHRR